MMTHTNFFSVGLALCSAAAFFSTASAQDQRASVASTVTFVREADGVGIRSHGRLRTLPNATAWGDTQVVWEGSGPTSPSLSLPLQRVLGGFSINASDYLFFGRRHLSGGGHVGAVARLQLDLENVTMSLAGSVELPFSEPLSMVYDPVGEQLLILDGLSRTIHAIEWVPADPLPGLIGTSEVAGIAQLPALARPASCCMVVRQGAVDVVESNGVRFTRLTHDGWGYAIDAAVWESEIGGPRLIRDSLFVPVNRAWDLEIVGSEAPSSWFTVRSEGKSPVQFELGPGKHSIAPFSAADASGKYGVLDGGPCFKLPLLSCVRYGTPQGGSLVNLGEMFLDPSGLYPGKTDFVLGVETLPHALGGLTIAEPLQGELWIGVRAADGTDPISMSGDTAVLSSLIGVIPFTVEAGALPPTLTFLLPPIPTSMRGMTVFAQVLLTDGSSYAFTDVVGMQARDVSPLLASSQPVGAPAAMSMSSESLLMSEPEFSWDQQVEDLQQALGDAAELTRDESRAIRDVQRAMLKQ